MENKRAKQIMVIRDLNEDGSTKEERTYERYIAIGINEETEMVEQNIVRIDSDELQGIICSLIDSYDAIMENGPCETCKHREGCKTKDKGSCGTEGGKN